MASRLVEVTIDSQIATITLKRGDKKNALNVEMLEALIDVMYQLNERKDVRIVLLRGEGAFFCSGLDLQEAQDKEISHRSAGLVAKMLLAIYESPLVTIACVQGGATAGGAGIVSCCDFSLVEEGAFLGYPEVKRGLVAGLVMSFLIQKISLTHVKSLLLTGRLIDASYALKIGLISEIVTSDSFMKGRELALEILKGGPLAVQKTKTLMRELHPLQVRKNLEVALNYHVEQRKSSEAQEGFAAFLEKREPNWIKDK